MAIVYRQQLAEATKGFLAAQNPPRGWSLRQAERNTNIGYSTIQHMSKGKVPTPQMLVAWARAIKQPPERWLALGGYSFDDLVSAADSSAESLQDGGRADAVHETREPYDEGREQVLTWYDGLPEGDRVAVRTILLRMAERHKAGRDAE